MYTFGFAFAVMFFYLIIILLWFNFSSRLSIQRCIDLPTEPVHVEAQHTTASGLHKYIQRLVLFESVSSWISFLML